jgi:hypothetical protein
MLLGRIRELLIGELVKVFTDAATRAARLNDIVNET